MIGDVFLNQGAQYGEYRGADHRWHRTMQVVANLQRSYKTECRDLIDSIERLHHARHHRQRMEGAPARNGRPRRNVQNASIEQKDLSNPGSNPCCSMHDDDARIGGGGDLPCSRWPAQRRSRTSSKRRPHAPQQQQLQTSHPETPHVFTGIFAPVRLRNRLPRTGPGRCRHARPDASTRGLQPGRCPGSRGEESGGGTTLVPAAVAREFKQCTDRDGVDDKAGRPAQRDAERRPYGGRRPCYRVWKRGSISEARASVRVQVDHRFSPASNRGAFEAPQRWSISRVALQHFDRTGRRYAPRRGRGTTFGIGSSSTQVV